MVYTVQCIYIASYETMPVKNDTEFNDVNSSKCKIKILASKTLYKVLYYLYFIVTKGFATVDCHLSDSESCQNLGLTL